jgi:hypothetical protein
MLVGLLALDLIGLFPGVSILASIVAAAALLVIDARGLLSLNGLIKWRRIRGWPRLILCLVGVALFQWVVAFYIAQRLFMMALAGRRTEGRDDLRPARFDDSADATFDRPIDSALDADGIQRVLNDLLAEAKHGLPPDLLDKVRAVVTGIGDLLPAYRASGLEARDRFLVERTAADYLPSALHRYLKLPPALRSAPIPAAGGKTATQVLSDQLDLLKRRIGQVVDAAYREDVEALIVHGRFLSSKFGASSLTLDS